MKAPFDLRGLLVKHRELVIVTLAALAVRLWWNLKVHPPLAFAFADMGGYLERANTSIDRPDEHLGYFTLFPWGTHFLLSLIRRAFGRDNGAAIGVVYALLGALSVGFAFALARRFTRARWVPRIVGAILVVYYPWISLGGYLLSEPPFTLFLTATTFYALALADRGRPRDAWLFGVSLALGAIFRPQILVALPLYALHVVLRRRTWRRLDARLLPAMFAPLVVALSISAYRMEFHTGRFGLVSNNGPLNFAFGRCHTLTITATAPDRRSIYSPPSLGALSGNEKTHPDALFKLDPAMGIKLDVKGHMWDPEPFHELASECVKKTGAVRQAKYALTHVVLLWGYNLIWPDQGQKPEFRRPMELSLAAHDVLILPPALLAMALAFRRRHARSMLLALHVLGLMAVAMLYFGDTRLRAPYDGILLLLAVETYARGVRALLRRRRARAIPAVTST